MGKRIRLFVAVAAEKLADIIDTLTDAGATVSLTETGALTTSDGTIADDDVPEMTAAMVRQSGRKTAATPPVVSRRSLNPRPGGRVVYTPAGTQRQITAMLAGLQAGTMTAAVLHDVAKHPGTSNAEVRARLEKFAKTNKLSIESVDNVIWQQVNKGRILKSAK